MNRQKKKIYILYPDGHISYSPSVLNLYDELSKLDDVLVFSYEPDRYFSNHKPEHRNIHYIPKPGIFKRIFFAALYFLATRLLSWPEMGIYKFKRQMNLYFLLRTLPPPDEIIAVDLTSLWTAQKFSSPVHFLSLEIHENDPLEKFIRKKKLSSVIIQSPERYRYYFPEEDVKVFLVQNAPVFRATNTPEKRQGLIYNGTAVPEFGVFHCIRFIDSFPAYSLTIKGAVPAVVKTEIEKTYPHLLENHRLTIDSSYVENKDLNQYLAQFRIGFCFYDLSIKKINTFNYKTAPSGKLFAYLAAGTPVIASNIPGLSAVTEFNCGVLINDMNPETILDAVRKIEDNYDFYSGNCILAAKHYSFDKTIEPFIRFIHSR